ncbi:MAG: tetratricopeptide repeat protein [Bacteroidales bacterium]|nr:tetratricopeptide repeat protein [Bacteroidales bacterium]
MKKFEIFIFFLLTLTSAFAGNEFEQEIKQVKTNISGNFKYNDLEGFKLTQLQLNKLKEKYKDEYLVYYYSALNDYYSIVFLMQKNITDSEFQDLSLTDGIKNSDKCIELNPKFVDGYVIRSILNLFYVAYKRSPATTTQILRDLDFAKQVDTNNSARVYLAYGMYYNFLPQIYGGNIDSAKYYLNTAVEKFKTENKSNPILPDWGYDISYIFLGMICVGEGEYESAKKFYNKALEISPSNSWVSNVLMSELNEKSKTNAKSINFFWIFLPLGFISLIIIAFKLIKRLEK